MTYLYFGRKTESKKEEKGGKEEKERDTNKKKDGVPKNRKQG
jgi:hypothetical protein